MERENWRNVGKIKKWEERGERRAYPLFFYEHLITRLPNSRDTQCGMKNLKKSSNRLLFVRKKGMI